MEPSERAEKLFGEHHAMSRWIIPGRFGPGLTGVGVAYFLAMGHNPSDGAMAEAVERTGSPLLDYPMFVVTHPRRPKRSAGCLRRGHQFR